MGVRRFAWLAGASVAVGALASVGPASGTPGPDDEAVWESGTVTSIADGDTLVANVVSASQPSHLGSQRVRTIGVQAPEVAHNGDAAQCGAKQATDALKTQLPVGSPVQLRSVYDSSYDDYSDGRIVRSLYAQDDDGNWYDTSRSTVSNGWMMWFPLSDASTKKPEWAHNLEYRVLAEDAAAAARGLWASPCGQSPTAGANLRMWVSYTQSTPNPERVFIENQGAGPIDLGGWTLRDSALNVYKLPAPTALGAGQILEVQFAAGTPTPIAPFPGVSFSLAAPVGASFDNLPADNSKFVGDAAYLMDNTGVFATGNLRAWFPYPCNPDSCRDPLAGKVRITGVQENSALAPTRKPSAPGSVAATATTDGTSNIAVTWAPPVDFGSTGTITYRVSATSPDGGSIPWAQETTATSVTFSDHVDLNKAYQFTVTARNAQGTSDPSGASGAVTPTDTFGTSVQGPAGLPPAAVDSPWVDGEYVDVKNVSDQPQKLGGYGFWNKTSSTTPNGTPTTYTDKPALLLPANLQLQPGETARVHLGNTIRPDAGGPSDLWVSEWHASLRPSTLVRLNEYVELANLNRAQVDCQALGTGTCRNTVQTAISSSPVGVTAQSKATSVNVSWGAPISRGGLDIRGYTARAYDAAVGGNLVATCTAAGTAQNCAFPASLGRSYYVDVTATNDLGESAPSWRVLATPKSVPAPPTGVSLVAGEGTLTATWTAGAANGAAITSFAARAFTAGTGGSPVAQCTSATNTCQMLLAKGTRYYVDVVAVNKIGTSPASSPRVGAYTLGIPSAGPAGPLSTYSKGKVTVRWDLVEGTSLYSAKLFTKSKGGKLVGSCKAAAPKVKCTTKHVRKLSKYYIDLTLSGSLGSRTITPRIVTGPAKKASAPTAVRATSSLRSVTVVWGQPTFTGYSYVKGYQARIYSKSKKGSLKATCKANALTLGCTTKPLKAGTTYYAAVRVKNSKGWSTMTKRVKITVQA